MMRIQQRNIEKIHRSLNGSRRILTKITGSERRIRVQVAPYFFPYYPDNKFDDRYFNNPALKSFDDKTIPFMYW